jgi:hypothetical protein
MTSGSDQCHVNTMESPQPEAAQPPQQSVGIDWQPNEGESVTLEGNIWSQQKKGCKCYMDPACVLLDSRDGLATSEQVPTTPDRRDIYG